MAWPDRNILADHRRVISVNSRPRYYEPALTPNTLSAGTRLRPFEILSPLEEGGMGAVHRARDTKLNREVAIKVLLPAD